jgi:hypothetical protein
MIQKMAPTSSKKRVRQRMLPFGPRETFPIGPEAAANCGVAWPLSSDRFPFVEARAPDVRCFLSRHRLGRLKLQGLNGACGLEIQFRGNVDGLMQRSVHRTPECIGGGDLLGCFAMRRVRLQVRDHSNPADNQHAIVSF